MSISLTTSYRMYQHVGKSDIVLYEYTNREADLIQRCFKTGNCKTEVESR